MAVENEEDDVVVRMIHSASVLRSDTLDLSKKRIYEIPKEILNLKQLESLHLEGNFLTELPDEFFEKLTNLKWLDLRNNRLSSIPANVGRHRCLRSFLLEGNSLTHLPCELGMTKSLCGLHLFGNPLEFPPHYIVEKGTQEILRFLREMSEESPREEKYGESVVSDEESEEMIINSGLDWPDAPSITQSAGSHGTTGSGDHVRRGFKLPPIVRKATTVRRSNADISDARNMVQGRHATKFEPIRRLAMPSLSGVAREPSPRKRRSKRKEEQQSACAEVMMEEAPPRDAVENVQKIRVKKKRSSKKAKKLNDEDDANNNTNKFPPIMPHVSDVTSASVAMGDEAPARFQVFVGDMVAIKVAQEHFIKGQPCVGKVVSEVDDGGLVLVHYFVGSYEGALRPMMSRSSPYLRKVPLENILCKFDMMENGRLSPNTATRIRHMVER